MESMESEKLGCHTMTAPTVLGTGCNMNHSTAEEDLWVPELKPTKWRELNKFQRIQGEQHMELIIQIMQN